MPASVESRYDVGLESRCDGTVSPEVASTTGVQGLLDLAASSAAPQLFNDGGDPATADDAPMADWDPTPTTISWQGNASWWPQCWSPQPAKQKWRHEDYKQWGEPTASSRDTSAESLRSTG